MAKNVNWGGAVAAALGIGGLAALGTYVWNQSSTIAAKDQALDRTNAELEREREAKRLAKERLDATTAQLAAERGKTARLEADLKAAAKPSDA